VTDIAGRNEIGMRKGLISVTSPEGEFEIHKKAEQDEFEAFKQEAEVAITKENREFEEYKADTQKEFIEYKRGNHGARSQYCSVWPFVVSLSNQNFPSTSSGRTAGSGYPNSIGPGLDS
jgi:hypothetical protein